MRASTIAAAAVSLLLAAEAHAQALKRWSPVVGARIDIPQGLVAEIGTMYGTGNSTEEETGIGPLIGVGSGGGRLSVGRHTRGWGGLSFSQRIAYLYTWGLPWSHLTDTGEHYLGAEVRVGFLFTTLGVAAFRRIGPTESGTEKRTRTIGSISVGFDY